jgi:Putative zinc-finger
VAEEEAMDWNCTLSEERLSDYIDGLLSQDEAAALAAHAAGCAHCAPLMANVRGLVSQMHELELLPEPPQLARKILDATLGPRTERTSWKRWFTWVPVLWQPRFALGALTVAASLAIVLHSTGLTLAKIRKADLNPANLLRSTNRQAHLVYARGVKYVNDLRVVYEIQSRLQPEPEPTTAPPASPTPAPETAPPSTNPQQKSETKPPHDRTQVRAPKMFAMLLPAGFPGGLIDATTRSSR